jgi:hypothetical protein
VSVIVPIVVLVVSSIATAMVSIAVTMIVVSMVFIIVFSIVTAVFSIMITAMPSAVITTIVPTTAYAIVTATIEVTIIMTIVMAIVMAIVFRGMNGNASLVHLRALGINLRCRTHGHGDQSSRKTYVHIFHHIDRQVAELSSGLVDCNRLLILRETPTAKYVHVYTCKRFIVIRGAGEMAVEHSMS